MTATERAGLDRHGDPVGPFDRLIGYLLRPADAGQRRDHAPGLAGGTGAAKLERSLSERLQSPGRFGREVDAAAGSDQDCHARSRRNAPRRGEASA